MLRHEACDGWKFGNSLKSEFSQSLVEKFSAVAIHVRMLQFQKKKYT